MSNNAPIVFWRHPQLPFLEVRCVSDGRKACYSRHMHNTFSIGAITSGTSYYFDGHQTHQTLQGTVVLINPDTVHACNPIANQPWSYLMFYVNHQWLAKLQPNANKSSFTFQPIKPTISHDDEIYGGLIHLYSALTNSNHHLVIKQQIATHFFTKLLKKLASNTISPYLLTNRLQPIAEYLSTHCTQNIYLEELCEQAALSPYYLTRQFKQIYGLPPHEYLINRRIQHGQLLLKKGESIIDAALSSGFADQAHFQRTFKKLLSATPKQYQTRLKD